MDIGYSVFRDGCRCPGLGEGGGPENNGGMERSKCGKTYKH